MLISENRMHFIEKKLEALLKQYGVHHKYRLGYHPLTSGQVKILNCEIEAILEKMIVRSQKILSRKVG